MGLDMYLNKRTYVQNWDFMSEEEKHEISVKKNKKEHPYINPKRINYICEQVGYWRKANAIHKWFVEHVQGGVDECQESSVSTEKLKELLDICKKVKKNPKLAPELLPTQGGFFFGDTSYDEYYIQDIDTTIKILEKELATVDEKGFLTGDYYYRASW